ncbi:MAG TPA: cyanophycinase [Thermoanaerobaculia bacterium]|nr:cyanophycinase [Thermoanaerobaculia bacterium]
MTDSPQRSLGRLFAIGGAEDPDEKDMKILPHFVKLCGGKRARIVVCGSPSEEVGRKERTYKRLFEKIGTASVFEARIKEREDAADGELLDALQRATGLFFTGGDQLRLTSIVSGTAFGDLARDRLWSDGLMIGGTSAGAAAMSSTMVISGRDEGTVRRADIRLAPGLGYFRDVIIDTHFAQRGRISRLLAVIAQNPEMIAIGVDENTAIEVDADGCFTVVGDGAVFVCDGAVTHSNAPEAGEDDVLALTDSLLHILPAGYSFDLQTKRPRTSKGETIAQRA